MTEIFVAHTHPLGEASEDSYIAETEPETIRYMVDKGKEGFYLTCYVQLYTKEVVVDYNEVRAPTRIYFRDSKETKDD